MRYLSSLATAFSGGSGSSGSGIAVSAKVNGAVAAGELLTLHEGGAIRRTDPTLPLTVTNNNTQGAVAVNSGTAGGAGLVLGRTSTLKTVVINGAALIAMTAAGGTLSNVTLPVTPTAAAILSTDQVAVAYSTSATVNGTVNTTVKARVFNLDGTAATPEIVVTPSPIVLTGASAWGGLAVRASGAATLAVSWYVNTDAGAGAINSTANIQVYSAAGAALGSTTTFSSASSTAPSYTGSMLAGVMGCSNGDFLAALNTYVGDGTQKTNLQLKRLSGAAAVWGPITVGTLSTLAIGTAGARHYTGLREVPGGNIALISVASGAASCTVLAPLTGAILATIALPAGVYATGTGAPNIVPTGAGFDLVYQDSTNTLTMAAYDMNGVAAFGPYSLGTARSGGAAGTMIARWTGAGLAIIQGGTAAPANLTVCDAGGVVQGNAAQQLAASSSVNAFVGGEDGIVQTFLSDPKVFAHKCARSSIYGVAAGGASDGGTVSVGRDGPFTIPASQPFLAGGAFDCRANAVPGVRGVLGGQSVVLSST